MYLSILMIFLVYLGKLCMDSSLSSVSTAEVPVQLLLLIVSGGTVWHWHIRLAAYPIHAEKYLRSYYHIVIPWHLEPFSAKPCSHCGLLWCLNNQLFWVQKKICGIYLLMLMQVWRTIKPSVQQSLSGPFHLGHLFAMLSKQWKRKKN